MTDGSVKILKKHGGLTNRHESVSEVDGGQDQNLSIIVSRQRMEMSFKTQENPMVYHPQNENHWYVVPR